MKSSKINQKYRKFIRSQECCMCQNPPQSQAHHITVRKRLKDKPGMGAKVPDNQILIPLCPSCHLLGKKTGRPPQNLKLLLAGVQKVKCIMRYSSNCFGEFIPHSKFNKICNNCKSTHAYRSYV